MLCDLWQKIESHLQLQVAFVFIGTLNPNPGESKRRQATQNLIGRKLRSYSYCTNQLFYFNRSKSWLNVQILSFRFSPSIEQILLSSYSNRCLANRFRFAQAAVHLCISKKPVSGKPPDPTECLQHRFRHSLKNPVTDPFPIKTNP
jgi:hypothetical protein